MEVSCAVCGDQFAVYIAGPQVGIALGDDSSSCLGTACDSSTNLVGVLRCDFLLQQTLFWLTVGIACALRNLTEFQDVQRRAAQEALERSELENSLRKAELETMRMQLNPYFLFNCLQNISALARREPEMASRMLARLGDLLRCTIGKGVEPETPLATEIDLTKAYAAIEQMRFRIGFPCCLKLSLGRNTLWSLH
jgi:LytS/YehU family sensor histidine kinase